MLQSTSVQVECHGWHVSAEDQTSFHGPNSASNENGPQLTSENTRYVVIPQDVTFPGLDKNSGGNVIAVIYNNQLELGVFGDTGPTDIIGEASVRPANGPGIIVTAVSQKRHARRL